MKLSDYIKTSLGTFSPNPDEWTLLQRLGVEWGKQAFELEAENEALREWLGEDGLIEMAVVHEVDALLTKDD